MRRFAVAAAASLLFGAVAMAVSAGAPATDPICWPATQGGVSGVVCQTFTPNTTTTTTTTLAPSTSTSTTTSTAPTTVTITVAPASSTTTSSSTTLPPSSTTSTTTTTTTTTVPPPPDQFPIADIPSNFTVGQYLHSQTIPGDTSLEPSGNFRTICRASHYAHHDPIVAPGGTSAHLHLFFGNTAANNYSTYQTLRTSGNSTCEGGPLNRTGYWMPAVFDGQGRVVPPSLIIVYYKATASGGTLAQMQADIAATVPLPNGLRMIAGAPQGNFSWYCSNSTMIGPTIPNCPAGTYPIASVSFPDCWDGVHLDSVDHRSHMAYRSYVNGRHVCPVSHPVRIISVSEGFHWIPADGVNVSDLNTWFLSSDMGAPRGSTLHADWFGAWDPTIMMRWFNNCDGGSDPVNGPYTHMRDSNNGNLCDGQQLSSAAYVGAITGTARLTGYVPNAPQ